MSLLLDVHFLHGKGTAVCQKSLVGLALMERRPLERKRENIALRASGMELRDTEDYVRHLKSCVFFKQCVRKVNKTKILSCSSTKPHKIFENLSIPLTNRQI